EDMRIGQRNGSRWLHRSERVANQTSRNRARNGRVIFTAAHRTNPRVTRERAERKATLHAAEVLGQCIGVRNCRAPFGAFIELVQLDERYRQRDNQRARTAQTRRWRKVTPEG